jgi:hypothetical protein
LRSLDRDSDNRNHHAHILLTTRRVDGDGFAAKKAREWNSKEQLLEWREAWARHVNRTLDLGEQVRGLEPGTWERVDHRSLEEQGIDRAPTIHLGPQAMAMERAGIETRLGDHNRDVVERGAELTALRQERAQIDAQIIDLEAERSRRRVAELEQEIPYIAPVAAELARVASGQPGDGSPLAQRIDGLAEAKQIQRIDRLSEMAKTFTAAAERTDPLPSPELEMAWQGMMAAQGHSAERTVSTLFNAAAEWLPDPSEIVPRFWDAAAQYLAEETARREQAEQAQGRAAATSERGEDAALRNLFNAATDRHPVIAQAVEKVETIRSQERQADSQARGLLWLDQAVHGFERVGTRAADMLGSVAGKLADMVCDLISPSPQTRLLSSEEKAERRALESEIEAAQELRDLRDREQRERLASVMASLDYSRSHSHEQSIERTRERTRPGPG